MGMFIMSPEAIRWEPEIGFHVRLREIRRQFGDRTGVSITQADFAKAIDATLSAYKQWEAGNHLPDDPEGIAGRVESLTGVAAAWLLGRSGDDGPTGGGNIVPISRRRKVSDVQKAQYIYTARAA